MKSKMMLATLAGLIVLGLVIGAYFIWHNYYSAPVAEAPKAAPVVPVVPNNNSAAKSDLGSQIYEKSKNPISDKLPATVAPVPNPIQNVYKNPFQ